MLESRNTAKAMYTFGRSLHGLLWGLAFLLGICLIDGNGHKNAAALPQEEVTVQKTIFSQQWVEEYTKDELGCEMGRGRYTWRGSGFGSNINHLLNAWVHALALEGWNDLAVIVHDNELAAVECSHESNGVVSHGWSCVFKSSPHLCIFDTEETWQRHMNTSGVSYEDQVEAAGLTVGSIVHADVPTPLKALGTDILHAKTVMIKILWSSMTPWLLRDVHVVTHTREILQSSPFVGIHVRRGDKIRENSKVWQDTESYLAAAFNYLEEEPSRTPASGIKGIWVASDDETVVDEVRSLAHAYFPSVRSEDIVYVAGGVAGGVQIPQVTTVSRKQEYASFVYLLADLEQLAAANVFVGTFTSNIGRLVFLRRQGAGKSRSSSISLDIKWEPNRQRRLALD